MLVFAEGKIRFPVALPAHIAAALWIAVGFFGRGRSLRDPPSLPGRQRFHLHQRRGSDLHGLACRNRQLVGSDGLPRGKRLELPSLLAAKAR